MHRIGPGARVSEQTPPRSSMLLTASPTGPTRKLKLQTSGQTRVWKWEGGQGSIAYIVAQGRTDDAGFYAFTALSVVGSFVSPSIFVPCLAIHSHCFGVQVQWVGLLAVICLPCGSYSRLATRLLRELPTESLGLSSATQSRALAWRPSPNQELQLADRASSTCSVC